MFILTLVLLVLAGGCFLLATGSGSTRWKLVALGLFLWVLVPISQLINSKI